jgi:hypothetical protein
MTNVNITTNQNTVTVDESGDIAIVTIKTAGQNGAGMAPGGTTGQLLVKDSAATYDTSWTSKPSLSGVVFDPLLSTSFTDVGQTGWSSTDKGIGVQRDAAVLEVLGQDSHVYVKCVQPGGMIKGQVCMFAGIDPTTLRLEVQILVTDGTYPSYVYFGILAEDIAENGFGFVCTNGYIRGIDTSIYPVESVLWACTVNPGDLVIEQNLGPAPNLRIPTAVVVKSDAVNGEIYVRSTTGSELYQLHDVQFENEVDGDVLVWVDSSQRWENKAPANASAARSATIAEPVSGDSFTLFKTTRETTISDVTALVSGGSVTYEIRYAADRTAAGTLAIVADTVTNTTTGDVATVQNQPIASGNWVWLEITSVVGTVDEFNVSVAF